MTRCNDGTAITGNAEPSGKRRSGKTVKQLRNDAKELTSVDSSPALTLELRKQTVSHIVLTKYDLLLKRPDRVALDDFEAVRERASEYVHHCSDNGFIPDFQGLAAQLGVSREALYKYLRKHPDTQTGQFLESLRAFFADCRITATDQGSGHPVSMIFLLKNSGQGYRDKIDIEPVQPESPYQGVSEEALKQKYLADMAEDDE